MNYPKTTDDLARALDPILYPHLNPLTQGWPRLMQIASQVRTVFEVAGYVSPETLESATDRAEKAEARAEQLELERAGWARRIARVEALVNSWPVYPEGTPTQQRLSDYRIAITQAKAAVLKALEPS